VLQTVHETEWQCKRKSKGLNKTEYWAWINSITHGEEIIYPPEDFTIVECTDEDVVRRFQQLSDYISHTIGDIVYNIKWSDSKVSVVIGQDFDGNDVTIKTHFIGDDSTKDARILAEKWENIRKERDRLLDECDWVVVKAKETGETISSAWKKYRQDLRDIPIRHYPNTDNITWPTKPE
tara:strand:- start:691 stop:1227 length:537 start_codon:yes stop_codon:yes gene_type:complete